MQNLRRACLPQVRSYFASTKYPYPKDLFKGCRTLPEKAARLANEIKQNDIHTENSYGLTLLERAVGAMDPDADKLITYLLLRGAPIRPILEGPPWFNILHFSGPPEAKTGGIDSFIRSGKMKVNEKNHKGHTPLYYTLNRANEECVNTLIEILGKAGAWIYYPEYHRHGSPIHKVIHERGTEESKLATIDAMRKYLPNVDFQRKNTRGETPLDYALQRNYSEIADYLREHMAL